MIAMMASVDPAGRGVARVGSTTQATARGSPRCRGADGGTARGVDERGGVRTLLPPRVVFEDTLILHLLLPRPTLRWSPALCHDAFPATGSGSRIVQESFRARDPPLGNHLRRALIGRSVALQFGIGCSPLVEPL